MDRNARGQGPGVVERLGFLRRQQIVGLEQHEVVEEGVQKPQTQRPEVLLWGKGKDQPGFALEDQYRAQDEDGGNVGEEEKLKAIQVAERELESRGHGGPQQDGGNSVEAGCSLVTHGFAVALKLCLPAQFRVNTAPPRHPGSRCCPRSPYTPGATRAGTSPQRKESDRSINSQCKLLAIIVTIY